MEDQNEQAKNRFIKYWHKIPVVIRAIVLGMVVSTSGIVLWLLLTRFIPTPWAFIVMLGALVIYLMYFSGTWWPKSTRALRNENFRNVKLPAKTVVLALFANGTSQLTLSKYGLMIKTGSQFWKLKVKNRVRNGKNRDKEMNSSSIYDSL